MNSKTRTLNPQPSTLNTQPSTGTPKPAQGRGAKHPFEQSASSLWDTDTRHLSGPYSTLEFERGNCKRQFLGFQGEYTSKVEIPVRGVRILYSTS